MAQGLITPPGIISFVHVFEPRAVQAGQDAKYSCAIIFDPAAQTSPEFKAIEQALYDAGVAKFGDTKMRDKFFASKLKYPIQDAGERPYEGYLPGHVYFNATSTSKPGVVDARNQEIFDPADVWPGQLGRLYVVARGYDVSGNKGVTLFLNHLQILKRDMPRIDGRTRVTAAFPVWDEDSGDIMETSTAAAVVPPRAPAAAGGFGNRRPVAPAPARAPVSPRRPVDDTEVPF